MGSTKMSVLMMVAVLGIMMGATSTEDQLPSCAEKLIPCVEYLNLSGPLAPCCDGLREVVTNEVSCLCNLAKNSEPSSNVKVDDRSPYDLPQECGVPNYIVCNAKNGVERIAGTGISSLLLLGALLMLW